MPDQPSLFDLVPPEPPPQELPTSLGSLSTTPMPNGTDLPLPLRGRSGNPEDEVLQALRAAGIGLERIVDLVTSGVEAPPLNTVDRGEVARWVERATQRIVDPDQGRRLRRTVLDLLDAQLHLDYHARAHARRVERLAEVAAARAAGTYWRDRDARRTSTRPIHVAVDPTAWAALKAEATRRRTTLGETVGRLVRAEAERFNRRNSESGQGSLGREDPDQPSRTGSAKVFARIATNDEDWANFKVDALIHGLTVSRAVGLLVEQTVRRTASPQSIGSEGRG